MEAYRADIKRVIASLKPVKLEWANAGAAGDTHKAGLVPFRRDKATGAWRFYLMKPIMRHPHLGEPPFQICKGSCMIHDSTGWRDASPSEVKYGKEGLETMAETALREGAEEIGLRADNITALFDAGVAEFTAASSGKKKTMHVFAAEVKDENDFGDPHPELASTESCRWCTLDEYKKIGRADHLAILQMLAEKLPPTGSPHE